MERQDLPEQVAFPGPPVARRASAAQAGRAPARRLTGERYPPASPHHIGSHTGMHTEDRPYTSTEWHRPPRAHQRSDVEGEEEETGEDDDAPLRSHTSAYRYPRSAPGRTTKVVEPLSTRRLRRFDAHWLFVAGLMLFVMMAGWLAISALGSWWQTWQDDLHYGRPRTCQTDAVVGHNNDSRDHPSHFIALNLERHVIVLEIPAGDPSKMIVYTAGVLLGDGQDLTPVTLSFEDRNGDGKPDLNLHIGDQTIVFLNTGQKFVAPPQH